MMYESIYNSLFENTLAAAASSGDKDTWEVVLAELERREVEVTPHRMRNTGGPPERVSPIIGSLQRYPETGTTRVPDVWVQRVVSRGLLLFSARISPIA